MRYYYDYIQLKPQLNAQVLSQTAVYTNKRHEWPHVGLQWGNEERMAQSSLHRLYMFGEYSVSRELNGFDKVRNVSVHSWRLLYNEDICIIGNSTKLKHVNFWLMPISCKTTSLGCDWFGAVRFVLLWVKLGNFHRDVWKAAKEGLKLQPFVHSQ